MQLTIVLTISRRNEMTTNQEKTPSSIVWMAEELDFAPLASGAQIKLEQLTNEFLGMVAASGLRHCLYPAT